MFQFWKLLFLCGLLTGTSGDVISDITSQVNNILSQANPFLENRILAPVKGESMVGGGVILEFPPHPRACSPRASSRSCPSGVLYEEGGLQFRVLSLLFLETSNVTIYV